MFINPRISLQVSGSAGGDQSIVSLLDGIMHVTMRELIKYGGHLRQFIADDKGLVLIATFGLRGSTCPNMASESALPASIAIHKSLQEELGVDSRVGATFGDVYCGAVGGDLRHEYAVLGPPVNLAARLMASPYNPGVLVDDTIKKMASARYAFNALAPVQAKGYAEPVKIYEPLHQIERSWGKIQPNFVGRQKEIKTFMKMAMDIVSSRDPQSKIAILASQHGMGKTTTIVHCIEHIRKAVGNTPTRLMIAKTVGKESDKNLPFGLFKRVLRDVIVRYGFSPCAADAESISTALSKYSIADRSLPSLSCSSTCASTESGKVRAFSEDVLVAICRDLHAPDKFTDHFLHHMTGKKLDDNAPKAPTENAMATFMARVFRACTSHSKLVVIALDDIHHADELSWNVIHKIFETAHNVLFMLSSSLALKDEVEVDMVFWQYLNEKCLDEGRFEWMEIDRLSDDEVALMTMKTLGLRKEEVSSDLLNEVITLSGGLPHFVNELLEDIKRGPNKGVHLGFEISKKSIPEMLLLRIDAMDTSERNVLNIGAVIGTSFTLDDVVAVLKINNQDRPEAEIVHEAARSLNLASSEGILLVNREPSASNLDSNAACDTYSFQHNVWRSTLLGLMLDSRRRDLHKKIALSLEARLDFQTCDLSTKTKLLTHFKAGGHSVKAAKLALVMGRHLEDKLNMPNQSIQIYKQALEGWQDDRSTKEVVSGLSEDTLQAVGVSALACIIKLKLAMGKAFSMADRHMKSVIAYQDALQILRTAKASKEIKDRSFVFVAYDALFRAAKGGHIQQDKERKYESALTRKFLLETRSCGKKVHHIHALSLQVDLDSRLGQYAKAIAVLSMIKKSYKHKDHSQLLHEFYGYNSLSNLVGRSAIWLAQIGSSNESLEACKFVINEVMPSCKSHDVDNNFMLIFPVIIAMKNHGNTSEAATNFESFILKPYKEHLGEKEATTFQPLFAPIMMLLNLSDKGAQLSKETLGEYLAYVLDNSKMDFGPIINNKLGQLGQCADTLNAEICYLLAQRVKHNGIKQKIIAAGLVLADNALTANRTNGFLSAEKQAEQIRKKFAYL